MADNFTEPKRRYGWVWAIVTIGMFLGLIFWFFNLGDELNDTPPTIEEEITSLQVDQQAELIDITADPIIVRATELNELAEFFGSNRIGELVGRDVDLQGVPVESVRGDMSFWIGENADRRVFVVFDQVPTPTTAMEGRVDVDPDDSVNIKGEVLRADNLPDDVTADIPMGVDAFVYASELTKEAS